MPPHTLPRHPARSGGIFRSRNGMNSPHARAGTWGAEMARRLRGRVDALTDLRRICHAQRGSPTAPRPRNGPDRRPRRSRHDWRQMTRTYVRTAGLAVVAPDGPRSPGRSYMEGSARARRPRWTRGGVRADRSPPSATFPMTRQCAQPRGHLPRRSAIRGALRREFTPSLRLAARFRAAARTRGRVKSRRARDHDQRTPGGGG